MTVFDIGPVIIGVALILLVGAIVITAILKYKNADSVLKILAALGTLIGFILGGMGTYFGEGVVLGCIERASCPKRFAPSSAHVPLRQIEANFIQSHPDSAIADYLCEVQYSEDSPKD